MTFLKIVTTEGRTTQASTQET